MRLEIISRLPLAASRRVPLVFVHGSNSAAWVWEEHFLPYFARHGYPAHAVSLSGHGGSEGFNRLQMLTLQDYVDDLAEVVDTLDRPPVVIGHSMGGMVIQKYLEQSDGLNGAVLMASVPPQGLWLTSWTMALRNPILFQQLCLVQSIGPLHPMAHEVIRRVLFSKDMPAAWVHRFFHRWQPESQRVVLDLLGLDLPRRTERQTPLLVMGGAEDLMVPVSVVHQTAAWYGRTAAILPGLAHATMLDTRWESAAEHLLSWLDAKFGTGEEPLQIAAA